MDGDMKKITTESAPEIARTINEGEVSKIRDGDIALEFLGQHERTEYTLEEEKAVLKKIDWVLMPLMFFSYCIQYGSLSFSSYTASLACHARD